MDSENEKHIVESIYKQNELRKIQMVEKYQLLNKFVKKHQILFVGSSLMEWFPIDEMQRQLSLDLEIYNRGIAGFTTTNLLNAMNACIIDLHPSVIFINIGSNDIGYSFESGFDMASLLENYRKILELIKLNMPNSKIYVMAYYPVNPDEDFGLSEYEHWRKFSTRTNETIIRANDEIKNLADTLNLSFINVNKGLINDKGNLKYEFSTDGVHLYPNAYEIILNNLMPYLK